ncbi:MAG: OmpH family outer membrane protein [Rikenellaceae bacterium]|nr:OmpH family outer membrane protein [Rikenellaceae bacterium]MBQ9147486.1 OmpH family outer membrane protein [Rikenellaceae bacterium]MBR2050766.1 OmpH family outer membrane protein [Rikenellaceae bacterium]MBR2931816.1 OmpH family outer membrane protein [Rikenellaceae bacterium]MBR3801102.1 OmpH family outer membrane protein [Rikenellaceae bacterium]
MKKLIKLTLVAVLLLSSTSLFAQKMGRINSQELISLMPETAQMQTDLQAYATELNAQIEEVQVELNNAINDFQKKQATMKDLERQVAEKNLNDINTRLEQFRQVASEDFSKKQQELFTPIQEKAMAAIEKVSKAGGYAVVIDLAAGSMIYIDEAQVTDLLPAVKAELGIK